MHTLGIVISICGFLLDGLLIVKGMVSRIYRLFPLFCSYLIYAFLGSLCVYVISGLFPHAYPSANWNYYEVTILAEFAVLTEISDQVFRSFPAIRNLGRALAVLIAVVLGLTYILPTILWPANSDITLLDFTLRASVTKAVILLVLFYVARHFGCQIGRNVAGLKLGFSIYVGVNVAIMASAKAFGSALFAPLLWFMEPLAFALCLLVWTVASAARAASFKSSFHRLSWRLAEFRRRMGVPKIRLRWCIGPFSTLISKR